MTRPVLWGCAFRRATTGGAASSNAPPALSSSSTVEEIEATGDPGNTTIYVAGAPRGLQEAAVRAHFARFCPQHTPVEVRVFPEKQFCFVNYKDHRICAEAIKAVTNTEMEGHALRLSWGKMDSQRGLRPSNPMANPATGMMGAGGYGPPPGMMGGGYGRPPPPGVGRPPPPGMGHRYAPY